MAEKPKIPIVSPNQSPQPKSGLVIKIIAIAVALLVLIGIGFAAGIYLKLIDVEKLAGDMNLAQYPVIGGFFPKTNFETVELEDGDSSQSADLVNPKQAVKPAPILPGPQPANPNMITKEDLEKQAKLKQQEEAKRISKLARLYSGMKPEEAISIMKELDDPIVLSIFSKMEEEQVSKIMALFDPRRAARLTQDMIKGQQQPPNL
jgi:hypothetical protein